MSFSQFHQSIYFNSDSVVSCFVKLCKKWTLNHNSIYCYNLIRRTSSSFNAAIADAAATTAAVAAADHHVGGAHLGASCDWKEERVLQGDPINEMLHK